MDIGYPELKFADVFTERLINGDKTATIRMDLDSEIEAGKPCWLCNSDGERLILRKIKSIENMSVEEAAKADIPGHKSYKNTEMLVEALEMYYPENDVYPHSRVDIVRWNV